MVSINITVSGITELTEMLQNFTSQSDQIIQGALLDAVMENIVVVARTLAPKKTGALSASIDALPGDEPLSVLFVATVPYARYLEYGTKPHLISVKSAKALAFVIQGKTVFAKSVMNPGIPLGKFSFMEPAIAIGLEKATDELADAIQEALAV